MGKRRARLIRIFGGILAGAWLLAACATPTTQQSNVDATVLAEEEARQKLMALRYAKDVTTRANKVVRPILLNNADLCGEKIVFDLGFTIKTLTSIHKQWREAANELYSLDAEGRITIVSVYPGSPAEGAGVLPGDVIISMDNIEIKSGKRGLKKFNQALEKSIRKDSAAPVGLVLERAGAERSVSISGERRCLSNVVIQQSDSVNAYADGINIYITYGMLRFVENDDELAVVLAHEIAHNVMLHIEKKKKNAVAGAFAGALLDGLAAAYGVNTGGEFSGLGSNIAGNSYSVEFEQEADYVGQYLMARAAYDPDVAPDFWRKMGVNSSGSISYSSSHPSTANRFISLEAVNTEIKNKRNNDQALTPEPGA